MTKWLLASLLAMITTACAADNSGPAGSGDDVLPKRGALASDPTIVSARASCSTYTTPEGGTVSRVLFVQIDGSDPKGKANLGNCAVTVGSLTDQEDFGEDSSCYMFFESTPCTVGESFTVGVTVSNDTGGVTTASVRVTAN